MTIRLPELAPEPGVEAPAGDAADLVRFLRAHRRVLAITGAGCSTGSGIPAYRDGDGRWTRNRPVSYQAFAADPAMRRRYWARSYLGWPRILGAAPNDAHLALAELERAGRLSGLITQNVDGLHVRAGSRRLVELHGNLATAVCLTCERRMERARLQDELATRNPGWAAPLHGIQPDGDAELDDAVYEEFRAPDCPACGGVLKPDVVFFGERVPAARVQRAWRLLAASDALLVVGTSLVVFSVYRFVLEAARRGLEVAAINRGRTRGDRWFAFKIDDACDRVLARVAAREESTGERV